MSEDSREDPSNANVGSAVVVEKEELKDKEGDQPGYQHPIAGPTLPSSARVTSVVAPASIQSPPFVFLEARP